jgi:hypothetical protein
MQATFPATKAKDWADAIILRPVIAPDLDGGGVPSFALLEMGGPDPAALLLSTVILTFLVSLSLILGRFPSLIPAPSVETVTMLVAPAEPRTLPDIPIAIHSSQGSTPLPQAAEPVIFKPALREEETKSQFLPRQADPLAADTVAEEPIPLELMERRPPIPIQPQPAVVKTAPAATTVTVEAPKPIPGPVSPAKDVVAHDLKPEPVTPAPRPLTIREVPKSGPQSLGGLPLAQLIEDQAGLAAGLAALPSSERLSLPRVSIRVNAEWLAALPITQERLYFSITPPEADREVLAYVPGTHSFNLERPERPLWQILDAERVSAIEELRVAAGRWLAVPPELVHLYTWHPPVFENALRMFVLERMQELHLNLGPRDEVTVRLTSGSEGAVMDLEPIRDEASR